MRVTLLRALAALGLAGLTITTALAPAAAVETPPNPDGTAPAAVEDPADPTLTVAMVVPLVLPPSTGGLIDPTDLEVFTAPDGLLTRQLDAVAGRPAAIGIDPRIIASIRVLGDAAPESAVDWLQRLEDAPNESFALAYADSDVVAVSQAGGTSVFTPTSFDFAINSDRFSAALPSASPDPSATETPAPPVEGAPPLPQTVEEVLDWDYSIEGLAWPADDTVVTDDLPVLADAGYRTVLIDSTNVAGSAAPHIRFDERVDGIVADGGFSSLARAIVAAETDTQAADATATLNRAISRADERTLVVAFDRHWPLAEDYRLDDAMSALENSDAVQTTSLAAVRSGATIDAAVADSPETAERRAAVADLLEAHRRDVAFATIADDPLLITAERRLDLMAVLSATWLRSEGDWPGAVEQNLASSDELRSSVRVVESSDLLALGAEARLPVTVTNSLDVPVRVYASATPLRQILTIEPDSQPLELVVQPDSSATGYISGQAVANGQVLVRLSLTGSSGVAVGEASTVRLDLQAQWETVGILIVVILLVLVFGVGITRNILKRRRARDADTGGDVG